MRSAFVTIILLGACAGPRPREGVAEEEEIALGFESASPSCQQCAPGSCEPYYEACLSSGSNCDRALDCVSSCDGALDVAGCFEGCAASFPGYLERVVPYLECVCCTSTCSDSCSLRCASWRAPGGPAQSCGGPV